VRLEVSLLRRAMRDLRRLDRATQARVLDSVEQYAETRRGNVQQLRGHEFDYRLRVGDWRVLFDKDETTQTMEVGRVLHRREAYRR
jgi:mRNA interferase RelE/StbE